MIKIPIQIAKYFVSHSNEGALFLYLKYLRQFSHPMFGHIDSQGRVFHFNVSQAAKALCLSQRIIRNSLKELQSEGFISYRTTKSGVKFIKVKGWEKLMHTFSESNSRSYKVSNILPSQLKKVFGACFIVHSAKKQLYVIKKKESKAQRVLRKSRDVTSGELRHPYISDCTAGNWFNKSTSFGSRIKQDAKDIRCVYMDAPIIQTGEKNANFTEYYSGEGKAYFSRTNKQVCIQMPSIVYPLDQSPFLTGNSGGVKISLSRQQGFQVQLKKSNK